VCVPRLVLTLTGDPFADPIAELWEGAELVVPAAFATRRFRCALSGRIVEPTRRGGHAVLACGEIFRALPVAMLVSS
jgi:maltooligosyltrehalose synthase